MTFPAVKAVFIAASIILPAAVGAQQAYSPGQTFSSNQTPAPYQNIQLPRQPQVQHSLPVQQPVVQQRSQAAPMYNMSKATRGSAVKAPLMATGSAVKKGTNATPATVKAALPAKDAEKTATKPVSADKAEPAAADDKTASEADVKEAPVVAESTEKLVFHSRKTGKKQVALTYDDGPNPAFTPRLAEWLKSNDVPATFFVCGNMVKEYPGEVKKLADAGFELANHTYSHPDLRKLSPEKITEQLQDTHDAVKEITGVDMNLMRPPYGAHNDKVNAVCEKLGYKIINWDVDTEDWRKRSTTTMLKTIMSKTGDGSIILMHDRKHGGQDTVLETTKQAVQQLRAKGYTFVTVGELVGMSVKSPGAIASKIVEPSPEVSAVPVQSETVTSPTAGQSLPSPAIMTPAPILP